jgi:hypothetical protein
LQELNAFSEERNQAGLMPIFEDDVAINSERFDGGAK